LCARAIPFTSVGTEFAWRRQGGRPSSGLLRDWLSSRGLVFCVVGKQSAIVTRVNPTSDALILSSVKLCREAVSGKAVAVQGRTAHRFDVADAARVAAKGVSPYFCNVITTRPSSAWHV